MPTPKWSESEALKLQASAKQCMRAHTHLQSCKDKDVLDNCGACALAGRKATEDGPNYTGWARMYVEARITIPRKWKAAFDKECFSSNKAYAGALRQSIATFGYPKFK